MAIEPALKRKQYALNEKKIKRAQKLLGTRTEAETIERALDEVISDHQTQRRALAATEWFIKSGVCNQRRARQTRRRHGIAIVGHTV